MWLKSTRLLIIGLAFFLKLPKTCIFVYNLSANTTPQLEDIYFFHTVAQPKPISVEMIATE